MSKNKTYSFLGVLLMLGLFAGVAVLTAASVHAQTYTPPAGYTMTNVNGVYYNSSTGLYFYSNNNTFTPNTPAIPSGYQSYNNSNVYYNSSTGQYYNAITGQYSNIMPLGPAARDANGAYVLPAGYSSSIYGSYYNPSTGLYYDPTTGFYASTAPVGPVPVSGYTPAPVPAPAPAPVTPIYIINPGLPNTGAGGNASGSIALLAVSGLVSLAGLIYLSRKALAK